MDGDFELFDKSLDGDFELFDRSLSSSTYSSWETKTKPENLTEKSKVGQP